LSIPTPSAAIEAVTKSNDLLSALVVRSVFFSFPSRASTCEAPLVLTSMINSAIINPLTCVVDIILLVKLYLIF